MPVERDKDGNIILNDFFDKNGLRQIRALIRFYFHVEPTHENIIELWSDLKFVLQFDGKLKITEVKKG